MPKPFDRVYFDSNELIAHGWPDPTLPLQNLFWLSKELGIELYLPLSTARELEEHWIRDYEKRCREVRSKATNVERHTRSVIVAPVITQFVDRETALTHYRANVEVLKGLVPLREAPLTARSLEELFGMAIRQNPPFKEQGAGFQDAVIFFSVVDHLVSSPQNKGAFISTDKIFSERKDDLTQFARSVGAQVKLYSTLEEVRKILLPEVFDQHLERWSAQNKKAADFLNQRAGEIEALLTSAVLGSDSFLDLAKGRPVERLELLRIWGVETEVPPSDLQRQKLVFRADLNLHFADEDVRRTPLTMAGRLLELLGGEAKLQFFTLVIDAEADFVNSIIHLTTLRVTNAKKAEEQ